MNTPDWFPVLALTVVGFGCGDPDPATTLLARAADHELTVEEAARLVAASRVSEGGRQAALTLADLWVDYVLLATAAAEDSTFAQLDLAPMVERMAHQAMVTALRDSVVRADARIADAELRRRYAAEGASSEVRARQILLTAPPAAPPAMRDSARAAIRELRARIVEGGEDFAEVARRHSQDAGSVAQGGDMGFFGRGDMEEPFERAVYALEPGDVSEPVQTSYGYHIVRVEERRTPTLEQFRDRVQRQRNAQAAAAYVVGLEERAGPRVEPGAPALIRELARGPATGLGPRGSEVLVRYDGGVITLGDVEDYLSSQSAQVRQQVAGAEEGQIAEGLLRPLVRLRLLEAEARRQGLEPRPEEQEAGAAGLRRELKEAARRAGLFPLPADGGQGRGAAVDRAVGDLLAAIVQDDQEVLQLGPVSPILRGHYSVEIRTDRAVLVERRAEELRRGAGEPQAPPQPEG
jgi:hypothetical protein